VCLLLFTEWLFLHSDDEAVWSIASGGTMINADKSMKAEDKDDA